MQGWVNNEKKIFSAAASRACPKPKFWLGEILANIFIYLLSGF